MQGCSPGIFYTLSTPGIGLVVIPIPLVTPGIRLVITGIRLVITAIPLVITAIPLVITRTRLVITRTRLVITRTRLVITAIPLVTTATPLIRNRNDWDNTLKVTSRPPIIDLVDRSDADSIVGAITHSLTVVLEKYWRQGIGRGVAFVALIQLFSSGQNLSLQVEYQLQ